MNLLYIFVYYVRAFYAFLRLRMSNNGDELSNGDKILMNLSLQTYIDKAVNLNTRVIILTQYL